MAFKEGFVWGAATASYQIEGAAYEGGKGLSNWDVFCKQPGNIYENHNGDVACDHYHRMEEDVRLMKELGIHAYRFSFSWPRILPAGTGEVNPEGIAFYTKLIDLLLENGITPYATLFHWDYPYELQKRGGWQNPESPDWFCEYTEVVIRNFGEKIKHFFTFNEPQCFIGLAFTGREMAPKLMPTRRDVLQMAHNVLLAHGRAVQLLRAGVPGCKVGYAPTGSTFYPATSSQEDVEAARKATFSVNVDDWGMGIPWWSDPIFLGHYPEDGVKSFGDDMPTIGPDDMKTICQPLDFYGHNIYSSTPVKAAPGGFAVQPFEPGHPLTAVKWYVTPEGLYWAPKFLYERYKVPVMITENGLSCHDVVSVDGKVHDSNRIDFTTRYLRQLRQAACDGVDVQGYFHWSLMDNFEWSRGYSERFGLVHVDYTTLKRTPKDSFYWYRDVVQSNGGTL